MKRKLRICVVMAVTKTQQNSWLMVFAMVELFASGATLCDKLPPSPLLRGVSLSLARGLPQRGGPPLTGTECLESGYHGGRVPSVAPPLRRGIAGN